MPSDLLLDEPTNHLDLDALLAEQWLTRYPGTLLLISHDRDFLDAVFDHIVHMHHQTLELYRGNYSRFERTRPKSSRCNRLKRLSSRPAVKRLNVLLPAFALRQQKPSRRKAG